MRFLTVARAPRQGGDRAAGADEVVAALAAGRRPAVVGTVAGPRRPLDGGLPRRRLPAVARFDALSYSGQRRHVLAVDGARTDETRARRVDAVVTELSG